MSNDPLISDADLCADVLASYAARPSLAAGDARIVLTKRGDLTIVSIPGTRPDHIEDWITDLSAFPHKSKMHPKIGLVHGGCLDGAEALLPLLLPALGTGPYVVGGHSLGGGFGTLLVAMLTDMGRPPVRFTTFGGMRVCIGPEIPSLLAPVPGLRLRNGNDPVPDLPPWPFEIDRALTPFGIPLFDRIDCHMIAAYHLGLAGAVA